MSWHSAAAHIENSDEKVTGINKDRDGTTIDMPYFMVPLLSLLQMVWYLAV